MSDELWTLAADPAQVTLALTRVDKAIAANMRQFGNLAKSANLSANEQTSAAQRIYVANAKLLAQKSELQKQIQELGKSSAASMTVLAGGTKLASREGTALGQQMQSGMNSANEAIRSASYGLDDFLTVASQQGGWKGFASGVQSAANNFSFMLGAIHPGLILLPAIGAAALKVGVNMYEASIQTRDLDEQIKALADSRDRLNKVQIQGNQIREDFQTIFMAEEELRKSIVEQGLMVKEIEKLKKLGGENFRESVYGPDIQKGQQQLQFLSDDIAQQTKAIAEAKARRAQAIVQTEVDQETARLDKLFGATRGPLSEVAQKMIEAGMAPNQVAEQMRASLGIDRDFKNTGAIEKGRQAFFRQIVEDASAADLNRRINEKGINPLEQQRRSLELDRERIELDRINRIQANPRGKLGRQEERTFDAQLREMDAKIRAIDLQQREAALSPKPSDDAIKSQKTLEEIRDILQQRNLGGRGNT